MAAKGKYSLAAVGVGDIYDQETGSGVSQLSDVVVRQWRRARRQREAHEAGDVVGSAPGHRCVGGKGFPGPSAGHML